MKVVVFYDVVVMMPGENIVVGKFTNQLQAVLTQACYKTAFIVATYSDGEMVLL